MQTEQEREVAYKGNEHFMYFVHNLQLSDKWQILFLAATYDV